MIRDFETNKTSIGKNMRKLQRLLWTVLLALASPLGLAGCDISWLQAVKERRRLLGHRCGGRAPASTWATILSVTR